MPESPSILVLGAGELGMAVLRGLAREAERIGEPVRIAVLLRGSTITSGDSGKRRDLEELRALGVEFLLGDLAEDSIDALAGKFGDFHTVIGCTGFVAGRGTQIKLAHAVLKGGVKRYIPWQFGVDYDLIGRGSGQDLFDEQLDVRELLRSQSRMEWIIISTGIFTSFLFVPAFGVVDLEDGVVRALGSWDNAVTVTAVDDIGALTAAVVFADPRIVDSVVYTAGETLTYARLAEVVDAVLGRKLRREEWSVPTLEDALARDPNDSFKKYRLVFARGRGVAWETGKTFNARHGMKVVDVEQWAQKNLTG